MQAQLSTLIDFVTTMMKMMVAVDGIHHSGEQLAHIHVQISCHCFRYFSQLIPHSLPLRLISIANLEFKVQNVKIIRSNGKHLDFFLICVRLSSRTFRLS